MPPLSIRPTPTSTRATAATTSTSFGRRLSHLRRDRGLTQTELAQAIGTTQRVISYYERRANRPPAHLLMKLAAALEISIDNLVGLKLTLEKEMPRNARLWRRLRDVDKLPPADRKAVLRMVEGLLARHKLQPKSIGGRRREGA